MNGIGIENRTGRRSEALGMASGDAVKTVKWADECGDSSDMEVEEWNGPK